MDFFQALALGALQGVTEFLPVSSSGHLVILQHLFGLREPELLFDISLHVGTLAAICGVLFKDIRSILVALFRAPARAAETGWGVLFREDERIREAAWIVAGSVPTAAIGLLFHGSVGRIFGSPALVGVMLLVTGTFLWLTRSRMRGQRPEGAMTLSDALLIGLVQGVAILPGISRSGATIATALFLGIDRKTAGRFSFLLSIPAVLGALVLELDAGAETTVAGETILLGAFTAAGVGAAALVALLRIVRSGYLHRFAPYCWTLGAAVLIWSLAG